MIHDDWRLDEIIQQWGLERINRAIQPIYLGTDADVSSPQHGLPDVASYVISAAINDTTWWQGLRATQQNTLLLAFHELLFDVDALANDLYDVLNLPEGEGCQLADEAA